MKKEVFNSINKLFGPISQHIKFFICAVLMLSACQDSSHPYTDESHKSEAFANWRRTGIPELTPTAYVQSRTDGAIPRRFVYLPSEAATNAANPAEAISRQGPGTFTTRVWWVSNKTKSTIKEYLFQIIKKEAVAG